MTTLILQKKPVGFFGLQKLLTVVSLIQFWLDRHHQRKQLMLLDHRQLADLGLNAQQVSLEIQKPFWK
jgi:uncharacterized protein YjiS (DUF1127 family)